MLFLRIFLADANIITKALIEEIQIRKNSCLQGTCRTKGEFYSMANCKVIKLPMKTPMMNAEIDEEITRIRDS